MRESSPALAGSRRARLAITLALVFDGLTTVFLGVFLLIVAPQLLTAIATERRTR